MAVVISSLAPFALPIRSGNQRWMRSVLLCLLSLVRISGCSTVRGVLEAVRGTNDATALWGWMPSLGSGTHRSTGSSWRRRWRPLNTRSGRSPSSPLGTLSSQVSAWFALLSWSTLDSVWLLYTSVKMDGAPVLTCQPLRTTSKTSNGLSKQTHILGRHNRSLNYRCWFLQQRNCWRKTKEHMLCIRKRMKRHLE